MFWIVVCPRGPFGGGGGDPFTDASFAGERITRVDIRSGDRIDAWDSFDLLPWLFETYLWNRSIYVLI